MAETDAQAGRCASGSVHDSPVADQATCTILQKHTAVGIKIQLDQRFSRIPLCPYRNMFMLCSFIHQNPREILNDRFKK